jgi:hypothetical protein
LKTIKCPSCQSSVAAGKFCLSCGAVLISETEAQIFNEDQLVEKIADKVIEKFDARDKARAEPPAEPPKPEEKPASEQPKRSGRFFGS